MDGTIIDSTDAIIKHWHKYVRPPRSAPPKNSRLAVPSLERSERDGVGVSNRSRRANLTGALRIGDELGVDPNVILATSHGRRSIDVMKEYDPSKATLECRCKRGLITHTGGLELTSLGV